MASPPPCTRLGTQCRELSLTLRIADLADDSPTLQDAATTWLLGHTERMTFARPYRRGSELLVDATVHVPCRYLKPDGNGDSGGAVCSAHGFQGPLASSTQPSPRHRPATERPDGTFRVFYKGRQRVMLLPLKRAARKALPVLNGNPCAGAACRTADNKRGAACCRDLTIEVVLPKSEHHLEQLLRTRQSPHLCKVSRQDARTVECEVISACGYLADDGVDCRLHERVLPNGRLAKPSICRDWPSLEEDEVAHPGCRFA